MLPVATPPNAIVFAAGKMNQVDMVSEYNFAFLRSIYTNYLHELFQMKAGFFMNIICVFTICLLTVSYGSFMFGFEEFPDWALPKIMNDTMTTMFPHSNHTM